MRQVIVPGGEERRPACATDELLAEAIDPNSEMDWHSITVGWALARGLPPEAAHEFATFVRYWTDLA